MINRLYGFLKTIYFNYRYFGWSGVLLRPVKVAHTVKFAKTSGKINIIGIKKTGMIQIGFGDIMLFDKEYSRTVWQVNGVINMSDGVFIGHGSKIIVKRNGILTFGKNFTMSAESSIVCRKEVTFGDGCMVSWDVLIMDNDFHNIYSAVDGKILNEDKAIFINDNVWIGCRCLVLKGVSIETGTIVASGTLISSSIGQKNCIFGDNPLRILKKDVSWAK